VPDTAPWERLVRDKEREHLIAWNGVEAFDLLDAPDSSGVNKQREGKQSDNTKA
jgi:hypothetical protein